MSRPSPPVTAIRPLIAVLLLLAGLSLPSRAGPPPAPGDGPEPALAASVTPVPDDRYASVLEDAIRQARREVVVCTYLFVTDEGQDGGPERLAAALAAAAGRGVKVRLILERDDRDRTLTARNRRTGDALSRQGVAVSYDDPRVRTHVKMAVIDGRLTLVGSHNLTEGALEHNREFSLLVDSAEVAARALRYLEGIPRPDP